MTTPEAITKVELAINETDRIFPNSSWQPVESTRIQLDYILEALQHKNDRSRLCDINVGLIAVREFEASHNDYADLLHEVSGIVKLMTKKRL